MPGPSMPDVICDGNVCRLRLRARERPRSYRHVAIWLGRVCGAGCGREFLWLAVGWTESSEGVPSRLGDMCTRTWMLLRLQDGIHHNRESTLAPDVAYTARWPCEPCSDSDCVMRRLSAVSADDSVMPTRSTSWSSRMPTPLGTQETK